MNHSRTLLVAGVFLLPGSVMGDVLLIDAVKAEQQTRIPRPARGESMDKVKQHFGEPLARKGPVGDPPISQWEYEKFVVYFENDRVITSVLKREQLKKTQ